MSQRTWSLWRTVHQIRGGQEKNWYLFWYINTQNVVFWHIWHVPRDIRTIKALCDEAALTEATLLIRNFKYYSFVLLVNVFAAWIVFTGNVFLQWGKCLWLYKKQDFDTGERGQVLATKALRLGRERGFSCMLIIYKLAWLVLLVTVGIFSIEPRPRFWVRLIPTLHLLRQDIVLYIVRKQIKLFYRCVQYKDFVNCQM